MMEIKIVINKKSIKWSTTEPPNYMSHQTHKSSHFTETPTKQVMIAAQETDQSPGITATSSNI